MMPEIALNILDVAENSVRAGAALIEISVIVRTQEDTLTVTIADDGCGMDKSQLEKVQDPFFTTRTTRKVGLGIPFFKQAAECTGGSFAITSEKGRGTVVKAVFGLSHIDRMPLGDINATIHMLVVFHPSTDVVYRYIFNDKMFVMDSRELKQILGGVPLQTAEVSNFIREYLDENKRDTDGGAEI